MIGEVKRICHRFMSLSIMMFKIGLLFLVGMLVTVQGFTLQKNFFSSTTLFMGNKVHHPPKVDVLARDMELTPALSERVNNRVGKVIEKLGTDAISAAVVLKVIRFPTQGMEGNF